MALTDCPRCGERKFLEQFQKCTACGLGVRGVVVRDDVPGGLTPENRAKVKEWAAGQAVRAVAVPAPGEECPTCGKRMAMTKAQTQKAYRARKKTEKS